MKIVDRITELLCSDILYEEQLVKYIDFDRRMHTAKSFAEVNDCGYCTIKIEGMERIFESVYQAGQDLAEMNNHKGPVSCHLFWAREGSPSFAKHTDPYDIYLKVLSGAKVMEIGNRKVVLYPNDDFYLLKGNIPHQAINLYESWMLSFGLDTFIDTREGT